MDTPTLAELTDYVGHLLELAVAFGEGELDKRPHESDAVFAARLVHLGATIAEGK
jgi:acyl dehydratase